MLRIWIYFVLLNACVLADEDLGQPDVDEKKLDTNEPNLEAQQNDTENVPAGKSLFPEVNKLADLVQDLLNTEKKILQPVPLDDIGFTLFEERVRFGLPVKPRSPIVCDNPFGMIYFLVHGWKENNNTQWLLQLTDVLLAKDSQGCVVHVNWRNAAWAPYASSVYYTESIGEHIANLISQLNIGRGLPLDRFVVIGHSLGAHIAGWAGKRILLQTGGLLGRIIGLDPSGPIFDMRDKDMRLSLNDAKVVEVVHTDAGNLGIQEAIGTIDFYPNGGGHQPGCLVSRKVGDILSRMNIINTCSQKRSVKYFIEAIQNPRGFIGERCADWASYRARKCDNVTVSLGDLKANLDGKFFFRTNDQPPYAMYAPQRQK